MKDWGYGMLGLAIMIAMMALWLFLGNALISALFWVAKHGSFWGIIVSAIYAIFAIFVVLPLAAFRGTRGFATSAMKLGCYVFGVSTWLSCIAITYFTWGKTITLLGLLAAGIGIIPIGVIAGFFAHPWYTGFIIIALLAAWAGAYAASQHFESPLE